ncbi:MAG: hypothetical protein ACI9RP_000689 [Cyclobacteriaceae bacterium]|jgi:hypothetical protein
MDYLVEGTLISILMMPSYWIVRSKVSYRARRIILICTMLGVLFLPVVNVKTSWGFEEVIGVPSMKQFYVVDAPSSSESQLPFSEEGIVGNTDRFAIQKNLMDNEDQSVPFIEWLLIVYFMGLFISVIYLVLSFISLFRMHKAGKRVSMYEIPYIQVNQPGFLAASFFGCLYVEKEFVGGQLKTLLVHEKSHASMLHSFDILLVQAAKAVFWFNPMQWWMSKEVRLVNECEVDEKVAKQLGQRAYVNSLVDLASRSFGYPAISNGFGQKPLNYRIKALLSNHESGRKYLLWIPAMMYAIVFMLVGCNERASVVAAKNKSMEDVQKITTWYESSQEDTQQKDGRIVSIVTFDVMGEIITLHHQTTYPYDRQAPIEVPLWMASKSSLVTHLLDGLDLGAAKQNLLYGNDWPVKFAQLKRPPHAWYDPEGLKIEKSVTYAAGDFPSSVKYKIDQAYSVAQNERSQPYVMHQQDEFEATENKVSMHREILFYEFLINGEVHEHIGNQKRQKEYRYQYDGDLLISVKEESKSFTFFYDDDRMIRSEYSVNGTTYNERVYFYDEAGLKTKTEIYNVMGDLEYTIFYEYEFWPEDV